MLKCFSNSVSFACPSVIYDRWNRADIVQLKLFLSHVREKKKVDYFFSHFEHLFVAVNLSLIVSMKKESQYGMKILVIFTTKLIYRHAASEYYIKLSKLPGGNA